MLLRRLLSSTFVVVFFVVLLLEICPVRPHGDNGDEANGGESCAMGGVAGVAAGFRPGIVSVDGHADEWKEVDGLELQLLPAIDPDQDKAYADGKMLVKALHDGSNIYFMLQVDGEYAYSKGENSKCPSVALMFPVGENTTYQNMGGCKDMPGTCTRIGCRGHEVDIMHFSIGNAIPGRLYGGNPVDNAKNTGDDQYGHLVDVYAWNPHCRFLDGNGPSGINGGISGDAQNDWKGTWWHSSLTSHSGFVEDDSPYSTASQKGTYYFEFSRPLRTMDRFQQDVQFSVGQPSKVAVAFWYPTAGNPWSASQHYSASCDWLSLDISSGSPSGGPGPIVVQSRSNGSWDAATAFSLLLSVVAVGFSVFVGYKASRNKAVQFTPLDRL